VLRLRRLFDEKLIRNLALKLNWKEPDEAQLNARTNSMSRSAATVAEGGPMLSAGKAVKVSIYLSEGSKHHGVPTYSSILDFLFYRGVSGATVMKGIAGFGADHHMHSAGIVEISDHLPLKIEFVESREKVTELLGKLEELAGTGMIEMQETTVAKPAQVSEKKKPVPPAHMKIEGKAKMMRIYIGEADRWKDKPLYKALVEAMRANDIAGVTVYCGILGYGAHRRIHKDKALHLAHDCSIMLSTVDTEEKLRSFLPLVEQMVEEGLVVLSDVDIIKYSYRALEVDLPEPSQGNASA
jgi:PII-like signaling protein